MIPLNHNLHLHFIHHYTKKFQFPVDLVTLTEEILPGKFIFCAVHFTLDKESCRFKISVTSNLFGLKIILFSFSQPISSGHRVTSRC